METSLKELYHSFNYLNGSTQNYTTIQHKALEKSFINKEFSATIYVMDINESCINACIIVNKQEVSYNIDTYLPQSIAVVKFYIYLYHDIFTKEELLNLSRTDCIKITGTIIDLTANQDQISGYKNKKRSGDGQLSMIAKFPSICLFVKLKSFAKASPYDYTEVDI